MIELVPLVLVLAVFLIHLLGEHRIARASQRPRSRRARHRPIEFCAGLVVILVALVGPIAHLAYELFWVHMIQNLLLLTVAAPLIVLGKPWTSITGALPPGWWSARARSFAWLKSIRDGFGALARPPGSWLVFNAGLVIWHVPGLYDLTVRNIYVNLAQHMMFLVFGILFWAQVAALPPAAERLSYPRRIAYLGSTMLVNVVLSIVLAFAQHPLYSPYAHLAHRPGGISALADQQIGAGIMWTAGDMPFAGALAILVQRLLAEHESATSLSEAMVGRLSDGEQSSAAQRTQTS